MSEFDFELRLVERDNTGKPVLNSFGNPRYKTIQSNDADKIAAFFDKYSGRKRKKRTKKQKTSK